MVQKLKINDTQYPVTHKKMPRFMYPDGQKFDKDHEEDGLFGGHYIIFVSEPLILFVSNCNYQ